MDKATAEENISLIKTHARGAFNRILIREKNRILELESEIKTLKETCRHAQELALEYSDRQQATIQELRQTIAKQKHQIAFLKDCENLTLAKEWR